MRAVAPFCLRVGPKLDGQKKGQVPEFPVSVLGGAV